MNDPRRQGEKIDQPAATPPEPIAAPRTTLICFSHLRWNFVFQRPQHLMERFARTMDVIFWEEPTSDPAVDVPTLETRIEASGVKVATPRLPAGLSESTCAAALRSLLDELVGGITGPVLRWYYTPMMAPFSRHLTTAATVYDCMDELANFRFAPPALMELERELMQAADVVFTGGHSLYEAKKGRHGNIHPFPSSVDRPHFARARVVGVEPADQASIPRPRLGYYGVIDERLDLGLIAATADRHPEWHLVMVGPTAKIDPADLPRRPNIHYLGIKTYAELPDYLGGWDAALMPFAINEATRFISPTKTPEYLAGGRPVVSTAITDVARHYGDTQGVFVADDREAFIAACEAALRLGQESDAWLEDADRILAKLSWDSTFSGMAALVAKAMATTAGVAHLHRAPAARRSDAFDYLIVGAGFAGSVLAERLAAGSGKQVLIIDRRPHIGGNAFDHHDAAGLLVHKYGPHIFHTNAREVFNYLSRFTAWRPYEHRVLARVGAQLLPIPINRTTLNALYGLKLETDDQAHAFLAGRAETVNPILTSEDVVVSAIGRELYDTFFRGYTRKQWGLDPSELDKSVTARVPTRTNTDDRYFTDTFQAMPAAGYTRLFETMLDHPNIKLMTGVDFKDLGGDVSWRHLIYSGPIDEYFSHRFGPLPYRSLEFRHETLDQEWFQPVGTVNFPDEGTPYTRVTEYKHITGQFHPKTSITYELPSPMGDPYYPIPRPENQALYKKYEALALTTADVTFVGRLASYRYYNMDQVVGQALATYRRLAAAEGLAEDAALAGRGTRLSSAAS